MDELELSAADRDRLLHLVERKLPHLLDDPGRIDWYVAEVLSFWAARGLGPSVPQRRRDWPMTVINRMLRTELDRFQGHLPNPSDVRAEQAERKLAEARVLNAEGVRRPLKPTWGRRSLAHPREIG